MSFGNDIVKYMYSFINVYRNVLLHVLHKSSFNVKHLFTIPDPLKWSADQVVQWINWAVKEFSLQGVMIGKFAMPGKDILMLGRESFLDRAPQFMGDILWEHLEILQKGLFSII